MTEELLYRLTLEPWFPRQAIPTSDQSRLEISPDANIFGQQCSFLL